MMWRKGRTRYLDIVSGRDQRFSARFLRSGLWVASLGYSLGVRWRNRRFDRGGGASVPVPVVSIGNLTLGGTGKTPCVERVAQFFRERDVRPVILSRGYGGSGGPNDEALVLEENLPDVPHLQGPDRLALARTAVEELEAELLVLDDGFQHRRLGRDLDVVLIDATNPWGYGYLTPRGLLREPPAALKRAGAVVITKRSQVGPGELAAIRDRIRHLAGSSCPVVEADHAPVAWQRPGGDDIPPERLAGRVAAAFCGLGRPESFRRTLSELRIEPRLWREFPDHHAYTRADVDDLRRWAAGLPPEGVVVTTQKDAVKLRLTELAGRELWSLRIGMAWQAGADRDRLESRLDELAAQARAVADAGTA